MNSLKETILIADDDEHLTMALRDRFEVRGYNILAAFNGNDALKMIEESNPHVVLLDLKMPGPSGKQLIKKLQNDEFNPTIIVLTAHGTIDNAVEAMKQGVYDFVTKPFDFNRLELTIEHALERERLKRKELFYKNELINREIELVGNSAEIRKIIEMAQSAAQSLATILITGESGTGKEILARKIWQWSDRCHEPFVTINCVAIPEELVESELFGHERGSFTSAYSQKKGKFEIARGGTILLDEIGDVSQAVQKKLLRILQDQRFQRVGGNTDLIANVRVIATTNKDLRKAVKEETFRDDLFYRISVVTIELPPLRQRKEDISQLVNHFLEKYNFEIKRTIEGITDEALTALMEYNWPGNIRELENMIERAMVLSKNSRLDLKDFPDYILNDEDLKHRKYHDSVHHFKKKLIIKALETCDGHQGKAAGLLGLQRTYFIKLMRKFGIPAKNDKIKKEF